MDLNVGSECWTISSFLVILAISDSVMLLITLVFAVTVYSIPEKETTRISLSCHDRILGTNGILHRFKNGSSSPGFL